MGSSKILSRIARGFVIGFALYGVGAALVVFWLTSELGFMRRFRTERQECAKGVSIPYEEKDQNRKLSRFFEFAGLSPSSTEDDVLRLYGAPEERGSYGNLTFLNDAVTISIDRKTVDGVDLRNRFALLGGPGIQEPLSVYLGRPASAVLEEFGLPHQAHAGRLTYKFSGAGKTGSVEFECYEFRECLCTAISVRWRVL